MNDHGCKEGCLIAMGKGKWHQVNCEKWTLARCLICWDQEDYENATDVDSNHIFQKHFPDCKGCHLIQNSEGVVSIQHQGHLKDAIEDFAPQCCDAIEAEEEKAKIEEQALANGDFIDYDGEEYQEEEDKIDDNPNAD